MKQLLLLMRNSRVSERKNTLPQAAETTTPNSAISFWQNRTFCFDRVVVESTTITTTFGSG